ncbi:hypothetical protein LNS10_001874 [Salmonella enterica]|nr:hypothetical protein [Salmonella enterica]EIM6318572.1 hypothetical protein [Salmonella enterica]
MATVIQIVIEEKNGRIQTAMAGGGKGKATKAEVEQVMALALVIKEALAASGGKLHARFDVDKAMKSAGAKTH